MVRGDFDPGKDALLSAGVATGGEEGFDPLLGGND